VVHSYGELQRLLDAYIREQERALRQVENKEPKNKKKIKVLKTRITKAENRKKEEDRKWRIQRENEEILLLLAS
jgi:hypothetical protein